MGVVNQVLILSWQCPAVSVECSFGRSDTEDFLHQPHSLVACNIRTYIQLLFLLGVQLRIQQKMWCAGLRMCIVVPALLAYCYVHTYV